MLEIEGMELWEEKIFSKRPEAILFDLGGTLLHDSISGGLSGRIRSRLASEAFTPFVEEGLNLPEALAEAMDATYRDGLTRMSHYRSESDITQSSTARRNTGTGEGIAGRATLQGVDPASPAPRRKAHTSARTSFARHEFRETCGLKEFHVKKWLEAHHHSGGSDSSGSPEELERLIRSAIISYSPPEDASRVLRELLRLGIPMGVVSNSIFSSDLLRSDLQEHSVVEAFRFVVSSAEFGLRKPHPAIFEQAVDKLKARPAATWYVGDLWENDVVGSSRAGLLPVWLNADESPPPAFIPHLRARNWAELGKLLGL